MNAIGEGLLSKPIPREHHRPFSAVVQREGEHAVSPLERRLETPRLDGTQQHLGVRTAKAVPALGPEAPAEVAEVVDLAIERDDEPAVR